MPSVPVSSLCLDLTITTTFNTNTEITIFSGVFERPGYGACNTPYENPVGAIKSTLIPYPSRLRTSELSIFM